MYRSFDELNVAEKAKLVKVIAQKKNGQIDEDWSEICADFDLDINSETLRKAGVGIKLASDAQMLSEQKEDVSNGYIERQKLRDLNNKINTLYRTESRSELLRETVKEAVANLPNIDVPEVRSRIENEKTLVVALGDFHYGADICVHGLRGEVINRYDHEVFEERMAQLHKEIVKILKKEYIEKVNIFLVGDLIDGMLRQSQLMRLEYGVVESTMRLSEYLAIWLNKLSKSAMVEVFAVTGNHSEVRPLKSKCREFEDENLEKIVVWYLQERLRDNENIEVNFACNKYLLTEIQGFSFLLLHGDGDKAISQIARETVNMYSEKIDFFVCGHKHREEEIPAGTTSDGNSVVIRTPSLCGVDSYAQSRGYCGKPGAIATVIERGYGRRCVYPINL